MLKLAKALLLATISLIAVQGQKAHAASIPVTLDLLAPFQQFNVTQHQAGADGNVRFLWDYTTGGTYGGSALWIINSQDQIVATGDTLIPATIGTGISAPTLGASFGNHGIHVAPSGNTTVVFPFVVVPASAGTPAGVNGFSTWTFNAQGKLIAFAGPYGPFGGAALGNLEFKNDTLIAQWYNDGTPTGPVSVWSLDEFGNIITAGGPFGGFGNTTLLVGVDAPQINGSPVQIWHWLTISSGSAGENIWTVNQSGTITSAASYGPF